MMYELYFQIDICDICSYKVVFIFFGWYIYVFLKQFLKIKIFMEVYVQVFVWQIIILICIFFLEFCWCKIIKKGMNIYKILNV